MFRVRFMLVISIIMPFEPLFLFGHRSFNISRTKEMKSSESYWLRVV
jgi:hypothetical protein